MYDLPPHEILDVSDPRQAQSKAHFACVMGHDTSHEAGELHPAVSFLPLLSLLKLREDSPGP